MFEIDLELSREVSRFVDDRRACDFMQWLARLVAKAKALRDRIRNSNFLLAIDSRFLIARSISRARSTWCFTKRYFACKSRLFARSTLSRHKSRHSSKSMIARNTSSWVYRCLRARRRIAWSVTTFWFSTRQTKTKWSSCKSTSKKLDAKHSVRWFDFDNETRSKANELRRERFDSIDSLHAEIEQKIQSCS